MAALESTEEVKRFPYEGANLKCPVCEANLVVEALVKIKTGSARYAGSAGFMEPIVTVHVETDIQGFEINHSCTYKKPKER